MLLLFPLAVLRTQARSVYVRAVSDGLQQGQ